MELRQVKGNTWVLDSWELIPLYKLDAHRCVLLDTGTWDQRRGWTRSRSCAATPTWTTWAATPISRKRGERRSL